ncbi:MAG: RnfABCDGE type electron transport complex subunit B [Pseudomonadota bacterium]
MIALTLVWATRRFPPRGEEPIVSQVNALLPQTQCAQCGYPGCLPYAAAVVRGEAEIDQCAPGGENTIAALAELLDRPRCPPNPHFGPNTSGHVAVIDERVCIGCAICLAYCPVDAIIGASRYSHTVIESDCTGCTLCIEPCPVDCIRLIPDRVVSHDWHWSKPTLNLG